MRSSLIIGTHGGCRNEYQGLVVNSLMAFFLVAQGCAFLVWIVLAFRWLFALRADAVTLSGRTLPDMPTQLQAFRAGLVEPRYRRHRKELLLVTIMLIALSALSVVIIN